MFYLSFSLLPSNPSLPQEGMKKNVCICWIDVIMRVSEEIKLNWHSRGSVACYITEQNILFDNAFVIFIKLGVIVLHLLYIMEYLKYFVRLWRQNDIIFVSIIIFYILNKLILLKMMIESTLAKAIREGFMGCSSDKMSFQGKERFQNLDI